MEIRELPPVGRRGRRVHMGLAIFETFYEMKAFAEINKTLSSLGAEVIPISSETPLPQVKNTNVIILGGPVANKIAYL